MKIGFIGCGNMGRSIAEGIINSGILKSTDIYVSDTNTEYAEKFGKERNLNALKKNTDVTEKSDIVFLCVKPNVILSVAEEIKNFTDDKIIVSIAAGMQTEKLEDVLGKSCKIIRVMPNTPVLVGEGMCGICSNHAGTDAAETVRELLSTAGKAVIVTEKLMDTVTAVSGSSPALVFMLIEAMADAGVQGGMTRSDAYTFAAQSVLGSAKMVLETKKHPGELKDMVCSPGGTTIDMVASLENNGFRNAVIDALRVCREKSSKMR